MPPIDAICINCSRMSGEIERALAHLLGDAHRPFRRRSLARRFSTSATMSPMPRMRPAIRAGIPGSPAHPSFSPVPISVIGACLAPARLESGAPPRPSPSTRVGTMPGRGRRARREARARLTASWPVSLGRATSSTSCGLAAAFLGSAASFIISSSSVVRCERYRGQRRPVTNYVEDASFQARLAIGSGNRPATTGNGAIELGCRGRTPATPRSTRAKRHRSY